MYYLVEATSDGGFITSGYLKYGTESDTQYSVIKCDEYGEMQWGIPTVSENEAESGVIYFYHAVESKDKGYVMGGLLVGTVTIGNRRNI